MKIIAFLVFLLGVALPAGMALYGAISMMVDYIWDMCERRKERNEINKRTGFTCPSDCKPAGKDGRMKLFEKVKCKGFYAKVYDGTYIVLDKENLKATHMNSNATDSDCIVEEEVDRVEKTYYKHASQNFTGVIVGFTDLVVKGYLDVVYNDAFDTGIGVMPEGFFVEKNPKEIVKCAIVYYANNKKHYVPIEDIERTDV